MSVALQVDFEQVKTLVEQCAPDEKLELVRQLENETFSSRLSRLKTKLSSVDLSMEVVAAEVEDVRARRYAK